MVPTKPYPKGIWYEKARNRWRVKLVADGILLHRSYHKYYEDAYTAWLTVKQAPRPFQIPVPAASPINRFLCQPLIRVGRDLAS